MAYLYTHIELDGILIGLTQESGVGGRINYLHYNFICSKYEKVNLYKNILSHFLALLKF